MHLWCNAVSKEEAKKDPAPPDPRLVLFMHKGGMSGKSISRALRIPYTRVLRWIKEESLSQSAS